MILKVETWILFGNIQMLRLKTNHDFIQLIFPTNKQSQNSFHGYFLDNDLLIDKLKNNEVVRENVMKSATWFLGFLSRNTSWISGYDHNQLRITRVIESLRLLVSDEAANEFFQSILSLVKDPSLINPATIKFWEEA